MHVDPDSICHVLVHLQLRGIAACWALDLFVSICHYRSAPFETALRKLNRKEEARPRTCSLVSTSDRFVNRAMASIMALVVGFVMIRDDSRWFGPLFPYSSWWSTQPSSASCKCQLHCLTNPHRSPWFSPGPGDELKSFTVPTKHQEHLGFKQCQSVPLVESNGSNESRDLRVLRVLSRFAPHVRSPSLGLGPIPFLIFFLWLNSSRERWLDLLEDFKNLRDVFLPLNRASGISRWQCECQKQIGTGHKQPTICCGQTRRACLCRWTDGWIYSDEICCKMKGSNQASEGALRQATDVHGSFWMFLTHGMFCLRGQWALKQTLHFDSFLCSQVLHHPLPFRSFQYPSGGGHNMWDTAKRWSYLADLGSHSESRCWDAE